MVNDDDESKRCSASVRISKNLNNVIFLIGLFVVSLFVVNFLCKHLLDVHFVTENWYVLSRPESLVVRPLKSLYDSSRMARQQNLLMRVVCSRT